jgi:putative transposase
MPRRRSVRLPDFDYASAGAYFVTLVAASRRCLFSKIEGDEVRLGDFGRIAQEEWLATPAIRNGVALGAFVLMPNHLHAIVWLAPANALVTRQAANLTRGSLGALVGGYKAIVTKRHRIAVADPTAVVWQRSFYEHIIRDEKDLAAIETYIEDNPRRWAEDAENPFRE